MAISTSAVAVGEIPLRLRLCFLCIVCVAAASDESGPTRSVVLLNSGAEMPMVGIGTAARLPTHAVRKALDFGYRLIDTAQATEWYSDVDAANALKGFLSDNAGSSDRTDVWVTTKIHPRDLGSVPTREAVQRSLETFETGYIDLVLLHYPRCWPDLCGHEHVAAGTFVDSWKALEVLVEQGVVGSIGVSNFATWDLKELLKETTIVPAVVQQWMDPYHQDVESRDYCKQHNIHFQSYSTLGSQWEYRPEGKALGGNPVLVDSRISDIANEKGWSNILVVLTWALQHGVSVVPRSSREVNLLDNAKTFRGDDTSTSGKGGTLFPFGMLDAQQMLAMDNLDGNFPSPTNQNQIQNQNQKHPPPTAITATLHNKNSGPFEVAYVDSGNNTAVMFTLQKDDKQLLHTFVGHKFLFKAVRTDTPEYEWIFKADHGERPYLSIHGRGIDVSVGEDETKDEL